MKQEAQKAIDRCRQIAQLSEETGRTTRTFLSHPMRQVHALLTAWVAPSGAHTWIDAAGNWRARLQGESRRTLLLGSHVDTVPNAGSFDGVLGVVLSIALLNALSARTCSAEIVAFSEEEGVRFGVPFIGSRALAGTIDEALLSRRDTHGVSVADAIRCFELDPQGLPDAKLPEYIAGFIEFHIEQGPVLESLHLPLAAVTAIAGQSRLTVQFTGQPNHAGTTPMHLRRDALAGAAEWCLAVEREGIAMAGLVATVGRMSVHPGAGNVVPGSAEMSLDVRHADDEVRVGAVFRLLGLAHDIAVRRGLDCSHRLLMNQSAVACDPAMTSLLQQAMENKGHSPRCLISGAGHDAMILAPLIPTTMLFLRSPGGISHHPDENVLPEDVEAALEVAKMFIDLWEESVT